MCPCVSTIASVCAAGIGSGASFSATVSREPWNIPQSTYRCLSPTVSRCLLPVTVPAAPTKVSSATCAASGAVRGPGLRGHRDAARPVLGDVAVETRVDQTFGIVVLDQQRAGVLAHQLRDAVEVVRDPARVAQHADQLPFVVRDGELAERPAAPAGEQHEVGAVDVVRLAPHQPGPREHDRRVGIERRLEHLHVLLARARRRDAETRPARLVRAEHGRMRQPRARTGDDHAAALGDPPPQPLRKLQLAAGDVTAGRSHDADLNPHEYLRPRNTRSRGRIPVSNRAARAQAVTTSPIAAAVISTIVSAIHAFDARPLRQRPMTAWFPVSAIPISSGTATNPFTIADQNSIPTASTRSRSAPTPHPTP